LIIDTLKQNGAAVLAPMAGVADRAFRELCVSLGAAGTFSELVSAKAVTLGDKKTLDMLRVNAAERPLGIQLFGNDPEIMAHAAQIAAQNEPDFIDINMGCPAPKILRGRAGAALMRTPELAGKIVRAVAGAVTIPVSVKMRTGWDSDSINCVDLSKRAEAAGAAFITVHGRTKAQMYAPPVDLSQIAAVKAAVGIPVIGNGDVFCPADARLMMDQTGCDLVMVGRGAMGNPWVFSQINAHFAGQPVPPEPDVPEKMRMLLRQTRLAAAYRGEYIALLEARKHAAWYMRGLRGAAAFRSMASGLHTFADLEAFAQKVCEYEKK